MYLDNGCNGIWWSSQYNEVTEGWYIVTFVPKMLILPLPPLSLLLVPGKASDLPCQGHCSSQLVTLEADIIGPIGTKPQEQQDPQVTCCPPGQLCPSQLSQCPHLRSGWGKSVQLSPSLATSKRSRWGNGEQKENSL